MSSKRINRRRLPSLILAVMLCISMVMPSTLAFAETAGDGEPAETQQTVTVAVESYTPDGQFKVEPTNVPYEDLKVGRAYNTLANIMKPVGEFSADDNDNFDKVITGFTLNDGTVLGDYGDHIYVYIGKDGEWSSDNEPVSHVKAGAVVRVICARDKEAVGFVSPTEMKVNRDRLYKLMAKADDQQKKTSAYEDARKTALDTAADQQTVDKATDELEKALNREVPATAVYIDTTNTNVMIGYPLTLKASLKPADSTDKVQWSVDDASIAKIENGKLTGLKPGVVKVTAKAGDAKAATAEFTVVPKRVVYVSIENPETSEQVMNPVAVPMNPDMRFMICTEAVKKAYGEKNIEEDIMTGDITGVMYDGSLIENSGDSRWFIFGNNKLDATSVKENQVVRLVYGKENTLGIKSGALEVNKDKLVSLMAQVPADELKDEYSDASMAYETAKTELIDSGASQKSVDEAYTYLEKIIHRTVPAESVTVTPDKTKLGVGKTLELKAVVKPENTTDKLEWTSNDEEVATVDENGVVKGLTKGIVTITAKAGDASAKAEITVTEIPVTKLTLDSKDVKIKVGDSKVLKVTKEPVNANSPITWTSSDPKTVSVDPDGQIIGLKVGSAEIAVESAGVKASCKVTVGPADKVTEPTVFFLCDDGRKLKANEDGSFDMTVLSQGRFVLEGTDNKEPYWSCKKTVSLGSPHGKPQYEDQYWVTSDGRFMPYQLGDATVTVYNHKPLYDEETDYGPSKKLMEFKINVVKSDIESIQAYCDGKVLSLEKPIPIKGTSTMQLTVKGKMKGSDRNIDIPLDAVTLAETSGDIGYIDVEGNFGFNMLHGEAKGEIAKFKATMKDDTASTEFAASSKYISVESMTVKLPEKGIIDRWNGLKDQYVGIEPEVVFTPSDASNQTFTVKNLNPDIAEYQQNHHNGVVPFKSGKAGFVFTSAEKPELTQTVYIDFSYKNPLKSASIADKLELKTGESKELKIDFDPTDATEQRFDWTYDKEGIVRITDSVVKNTNNAIAPPVTKHSIVGLKEGTVEVTGTPYDQSQGAKPIKFSVTVIKDTSVPDIDYLKMAKENLVFGIGKIGAPKLEYGDEWNIFTLVRSGKTITKEQVETYMDSAVDAINGMSNPKPTDVERVVLTLGALGVDCKDAGGTNLLEKVYNKENLDTYTSNDVAFGLIAYDTRAYEIPKDAKWNRENTINLLLQYQAEDGSFGLNKGQKSGSADMTGMCLQALAPYYKNSLNDKVAKDVSKETLEKVDKAVDKALDYLKANISDTCGFGGGSENSCSTAQVLTALTALKIDPTTAEGFTLGSKNMITNLNSYRSEEGFKYTLNGPYSYSMAVTQVPYALESFIRLKEGRTALYDETDVKPINDEGGSTGSEEDKLKAAVEKAVAEIKEYKNDQSQYDEAGWKKVEKERAKAVKNIEAAKDVDGVKAALEKGKKNIDKVKTKAQLEEESKAKIKAVEDLINKINPEKPDKEAIEKARIEYNKLTHGEKGKVRNIAVLNKAQADWLDANKAGYFYFCMQKITIGQGYLVEPQKVYYVKGDDVGTAISRFFDINGYEASTSHSMGWYLSKIYDAHGSREAKPPEYILEYMKKNDLKLDENPRPSQFLGEFDYTHYSGWVFTNNDEHSPVGAGGITATDGIVIRFAFTLYGYGLDCENTGHGEPILPNVTKTENVIRALADVYSASDKDELMKNPEIKAAYDKLYNASLNWKATQEELDKDTDELNKAVEEAAQAKALKEAKDKAAEELDKYKNPGDYREAQQKELADQVRAGKAAIDKAKTPAEVTKALDAAQAEIDKIKTDAQLKDEEAKAKNGWEKEDGKWYFYENGQKKTGWVKDNNHWYHMNEKGVMDTGWLKDNDHWYFLNPGGSMKTGWHEIDGKYYFFYPGGSMAADEIVDGWYVGKSGAWITGDWHKNSTGWWYGKGDGSYPRNGFVKIGSGTFKFDKNGYMETGWVKSGGKWYYMNQAGYMQHNGWQKIGNTWYYFHSDGHMAADETIDGWHLDRSGAGSKVA